MTYFKEFCYWLLALLVALCIFGAARIGAQHGGSLCMIDRCGKVSY